MSGISPDISGDWPYISASRVGVGARGCAFFAVAPGGLKTTVTSEPGDGNPAIKASRNNPIYGKSSTNQPSALRLIAIIKH